MHSAERKTMAIRPRDSEGVFSAGHKPRASSATQMSRPTKSRICQTRPMLVNSRPWLPIQKANSLPGLCRLPTQPVAVDPATMKSSA